MTTEHSLRSGQSLAAAGVDESITPAGERAGALRVAPVAAQEAERAWLWRLALLYVALSLLVMVTLDRFWSNNWDVEIITQATRSLWDGGSPWDLYELSRATWPWPFPYPPHAAWILVPFIGLADLLTGGPVQALPQLIAIRVPPLLADIGIAWLLHHILRRATGETWIARLGAAAWLFNPVLFYHTAVQAHQESTWMFPTLLAFEWVQERRLERLWWPVLLLVIALSLKQSAVFYIAPFMLYLLWQRQWKGIVLFGVLFVLIFGTVSLPYYLYSDDFMYMVFESVRDMPVQVQSWQVWALALPAFRLGQTETTFFTVQYAAILSLLLAALAGGWALWKGRSWYAVGLIGTLAFFLFSQKVMGYHYLMILPWLVAFALRARRFTLATVGILWTSWVVVSPYFAPWADAAHLPYYALLGTLNSLFYLWLLWQALHTEEEHEGAGRRSGAAGLARWLVLLTVGFLLACMAQPLAAWMLVEPLQLASADGKLAALLALLSVLYGLTLMLSGPVATRVERAMGLPLAAYRNASLPWRYVAGAALFVPLFFTWFTMTAEITSVLERGIYAAWGLT